MEYKLKLAHNEEISASRRAYYWVESSDKNGKPIRYGVCRDVGAPYSLVPICFDTLEQLAVELKGARIADERDVQINDYPPNLARA
ncbi:MAG: hypothetical protein AABX59_02575, partial [Nanoarchaeota archaeon]